MGLALTTHSYLDFEFRGGPAHLGSRWEKLLVMSYMSPDPVPSLQESNAWMTCKDSCWIFWFCHFPSALSKNNILGKQDVALQDISELPIGAEGNGAYRSTFNVHYHFGNAEMKGRGETLSSMCLWQLQLSHGQRRVSAGKTAMRPSPRLC